MLPLKRFIQVLLSCQSMKIQLSAQSMSRGPAESMDLGESTDSVQLCVSIWLAWVLLDQQDKCFDTDMATEKKLELVCVVTSVRFLFLL